eukprot:1059443-Pleurochrysis_carterae.AAC.1
MNIDFVCACPEGYEPSADLIAAVEASGLGTATVVRDPPPPHKAAVPSSRALTRTNSPPLVNTGARCGLVVFFFSLVVNACACAFVRAHVRACVRAC